jgi:hypothetical protein
MYIIAIDYSKNNKTKPTVTYSIVIVEEKDYHALRKVLIK